MHARKLPECAHCLDACVCIVHHVGVACLSALAWSPLCKPITPSSEAWESISLLSNSISTCLGFAHTGMSVEVAEKGGCSFRICCQGRLIFTPDVPSLPFLCFFVSSFLCFLSLFFTPPSAPYSHSRSKESADTSATEQAPVSAFLFFIWGCVGWGPRQRYTSETGKKGERQRDSSVLPSPVSFFLSIHLLPSPLSSHWPSFLSLFSFYLCLSFLVDNADMHSRTHASAHTHQDGIAGRSR